MQIFRVEITFDIWIHDFRVLSSVHMCSCVRLLSLIRLQKEQVWRMMCMCWQLPELKKVFKDTDFQSFQLKILLKSQLIFSINQCLQSVLWCLLFLVFILIAIFNFLLRKPWPDFTGNLTSTAWIVNICLLFNREVLETNFSNVAKQVSHFSSLFLDHALYLQILFYVL